MKLNKLMISMGLATAVLAGCSDSSDEVTEATIEGSAVKGALKGALVVACTTSQTTCIDEDADTVLGLNVGASDDQVLASTYTGDSDIDDGFDDGEYSLSVSYKGPVILRTLAIDGTTQVFDYTGSESADLTGLELTTITYADGDALSDETTPMNVLTSLATAAQLEIGVSNNAETFTAQSAEASKVVTTLLDLDDSINLFTTDIPSATADELEGTTETEQTLALVNASVGALVDTTDDSADTLAEVVEELTSTVATIVESVVDEASEEDSGADVSDEMDELSEAFLAMETEMKDQVNVIEQEADEDETITLVLEVTEDDLNLNDEIETTVDELEVDVPEDTEPAATAAESAGAQG